MRIPRRWRFAFAFPFFAGELPAAVTAPPQLDQTLETLRAEHRLPALAAGFVTEEGLKFAGVAGTRRAGDPTRATRDDQWHLGSDTKAMTAVLIATLVEEGKLTWDTTVAQVFPHDAPAFAPALRSTTLAQLLCHRAGLPHDVAWRAIERGGGPLPGQRLAAMKRLQPSDYLSAPGTAYSYSNAGFVFAAALAEQVTGKSWEELIVARVFRPLGMTAFGFGGAGTPGKIDQPWPHTGNGRPLPFNGPAADNPPVMAPAGGVHVTLEDWAKFLADQLRGLNGRSPTLLKPATYRLMHTPPAGGNYAFGWLCAQRAWAGGAVFNHAGSNTFNYCVVWLAPAKSQALIACSNQGGPAAASACDQAVQAVRRLSQSPP